MNMELVVWVLVFVGGYSVVLAWLLRVALGAKPPAAGPPQAGPGPDQDRT